MDMTVQRLPVGAANLPAQQNGRMNERHAYTGKVVRLGENLTECGALDLSQGGVGLLMPEPLEIGQLVHLAFLGRSIAVRGFITHMALRPTGDWRVGIRFLHPEPELTEVALLAS